MSTNLHPLNGFRPDIVWIGAGPVGLWTAIQTRLLCPTREVLMFEKHSDYQRSHVLNLNAAAFKKSVQDPRLQKIIKEFSAIQTPRTNDIESKLKRFALDLGIKIHYEDITDPKKLKEQFPSAKVIVGADGSHSIVKRAIFGEGLRINENLQYVAEVKYEVLGKGYKLNFLKEAYPTLKLMNCIATENVGKERDGKTPITLRVFIDQTAFNQMQDARFNSPYTFATHTELIHRTLLDNIHTWMRVKREQVGEMRIHGSEKITVTRLGVYASKAFVKHDKDTDTTYALVGDSAFGVPFFQGLKNGFLSGTKLSKAIADSFTPDHPKKVYVMKKILPKDAVEGSPSLPFLSYAAHMRKFSEREALYARVKNVFIRLFLWFVRLSRVVPWQTNKWSEAQAVQFRRPISV